jgi:hypothetical protein
MDLATIAQLQALTTLGAVSKIRRLSTVQALDLDDRKIGLGLGVLSWSYYK